MVCLQLATGRILTRRDGRLLGGRNCRRHGHALGQRRRVGDNAERPQMIDQIVQHVHLVGRHVVERDGMVRAAVQPLWITQKSYFNTKLIIKQIYYDSLFKHENIDCILLYVIFN